MDRFFRSFYFAGFEGTTAVNHGRERLDLVAATGHDRHATSDYARLVAHRMFAARESVRWPLVDRGGRYDFRSLDPIAAAAQRYRVQVLFDLFHFGYPGDTEPFDSSFVDRFASYCRAAARAVASRFPPPYTFTPVNEPSYFAWAAGTAGVFAPYLRDSGPELKRRLIEAAIAGTEAIWSVLPDASIVSVDPVCYVVPPADRPSLREAVAGFNRGAVFESWDMIAGRLEPGLGGSPRHLGTVGVNYYWTNQWELDGAPGPLAEDDPRRLPLRELLLRVWERYDAPLLITETAATGEARAAWIRTLAEECEALLAMGVPLRGACLYPVVSMPEWHAPTTWTPLGLWDVASRGSASARLGRVPHWPALHALDEAQRRIERRWPATPGRGRARTAGAAKRIER